jgi:hypothetical protein
LSLDPIDDGYQADKEQSAKTVVQAHGQSTVCSESIPRSMTIKTFQKVEQYVFYRLGHMSGTDSPSGNGGSRHSLLMESPTEVGFTTAEKEGNSITLEACRPWNLAEVSYLCAFEGCQVICSLMDGVSGICPKCGPFSTVRYCCKEHLWNDAVVHWQHCGKLAFPYQCQAGPLPERFLIGPPLVPSFHGWDSPERHRQALWFSTANEHGDYFVFTDTYRPPKWDSGTPVSRGPLCSAQVELVVRLDNPKWKARFRRLLAISLFGKCSFVFKSPLL